MSQRLKSPLSDGCSRRLSNFVDKKKNKDCLSLPSSDPAGRQAAAQPSLSGDFSRWLGAVMRNINPSGRFRPRMGLSMHLLQPLRGDVGVKLCRRQAAVA